MSKQDGLVFGVTGLLAFTVSTAYYLHWIPEIADTASRLFERQYGHLITGEAS